MIYTYHWFGPLYIQNTSKLWSIDECRMYMYLTDAIYNSECLVLFWREFGRYENTTTKDQVIANTSDDYMCWNFFLIRLGALCVKHV